MQERATALTDPEVLDQLSELILARLSDRQKSNCLLSSGSWVRIPPGTPDVKISYEIHPLPRPSPARGRVFCKKHPLLWQKSITDGG